MSLCFTVYYEIFFLPIVSNVDSLRSPVRGIPNSCSFSSPCILNTSTLYTVFGLSTAISPDAVADEFEARDILT